MNLVSFEAVSKRYRLGLSQTSLPALAADTVRNWLGRRRVAHDGAEVLWALRDVSFRLGSGDSLALIGPNGAGKTTILKLLANITRPSAGRVEVRGRLSALIELGAGFHPELTGRDNVFLNGTILGLRRREIAKQFDEIVDFAGIERFIDTPVKRYSSGMIVRLGFAVAACIEPEVLLVDEVLAVGDAAFSQKCLARIRSLIDRGTALVFVSHNVYLVKAVCRQALYLREGCMRRIGPTGDVIGMYEQELHVSRAKRLEGPSDEAQAAAGDIEITAVEMVTPGPASAPVSFRSEAPAELRVRYQAYADLGRLQLSVFIRRSDGLSCCMLRSSLNGALLSIRRGEGVVSIVFERLQLSGGAYYAEAFFLDASDALVLTPGGRQSNWFTVDSHAMSSTADAGVFQPVVQWSHADDGRQQAQTSLG